MLGMNGNAAGVGSSSGGGGGGGGSGANGSGHGNVGPSGGARQQRPHHFNPHQTPTFHPQQNYGTNHQYGGPNANHHHGFATQQQQQHSYGGAGGGGGGNFVPNGAAPNGYGGYEFIPAQQQAGYMQHQYGGTAGYGQMAHGGGPAAAGYYYPPGNAMMGMGMNMGMGPAGAGLNSVAPGYQGMMMSPGMQPSALNYGGPPAPSMAAMGMGGMQNGTGRFPPTFTPQSQHALPQHASFGNSAAGPGMGGANGHGALGVSASSPYPAYHHASSSAAPSSSSVTSPSLSNTTANTATTPATTATTTATVGSFNGSVSSPPNNAVASQTGGAILNNHHGGYMDQNPYAHLHQQHANHPHHNPYANMQAGGSGPSAAASSMPLGMSPSYQNGGLYQPYGPPHPQQTMQNGPAGGSMSPAHMHAPVHSLSVTPKMNHRAAYGYPVLPNTVNSNVNGPARKPSVVISAHDSGISMSGSQSGRGPSVSENGSQNVDGAAVDEEGESEVDGDEPSDSEPVFASINQAVVGAKKAKKSKRKAHVEEVNVSNPSTEEPVVAEKKDVEATIESSAADVTPAVPEQQLQITETFTDKLESFNDDPSGSRSIPSAWISSGRPHPIETAPGVVFNKSTAFPAHLYPIINTWDQIESKGKSVKGKGKARSQDKAVSLRKRRRGGKGVEIEFGEVSRALLAEVEKAKEAASASQESVPTTTTTEQDESSQIQEASKFTEEVKPEVIDETVETKQTPTTEEASATIEAKPVDSSNEGQTAAPVSVTTPSASPAPPVAKAAPKSWAALLRGPAPKSTSSTSASVATPVAPVPPSNITSETLAQSAVVEEVPGSNENQSPKKVIVAESVPGTTIPAPSAKPANAWGARPIIVPDQLDLGRLLADGLDERTRASLKKVTSVPRGLINTGNMCFANSVSHVE